MIKFGQKFDSSFPNFSIGFFIPLSVYVEFFLGKNDNKSIYPTNFEPIFLRAFFVLKIFFWNQFQLGLATLILGMFFFSSVQLFSIGLMGENIPN